MSHKKTPLEMAFLIESIAVESLVSALKAQMTESDFEEAVSIACSIAQKKAPESFCFTVVQAVKRVSGEKN